MRDKEEEKEWIEAYRKGGIKIEPEPDKLDKAYVKQRKYAEPRPAITIDKQGKKIQPLLWKGKVILLALDREKEIVIEVPDSAEVVLDLYSKLRTKSIVYDPVDGRKKQYSTVKISVWIKHEEIGMWILEDLYEYLEGL